MNDERATHTHESLLSGQFILILFTTTLFGLAFSSYFLFPKFLASELSADAATIGGVSAITMFVSVVFMPIVGVEIDRRGRRPFGFFGAALFALASAGFLVVDRIGPLMWFLRATQGAAFTLVYLSLSTLTTDLAPARRLGQAIGLFGGVMISTNAIGPALAEWAAQGFGWSTVFIATAISAGLAATLTTRIAEQPHKHAHETGAGMVEVIRRPGLRRILLVAVLTGMAMGTVFTFYQPWALTQGFEHVSGFLIAFAACAMFVRIGLGGLADRVGRQRVATISLFVYIAAPFSMIWVNHLGLFLTGGLLGISHGLFFPALNAVALDSASTRERGKAMAAFHGAFNVGFAAGSYLLGNLAVATNYPTIFVVAGTSCVAAFVLLVTARPHAK
jgi:MFS family permease